MREREREREREHKGASHQRLLAAAVCVPPSADADVYPVLMTSSQSKANHRKAAVGETIVRIDQIHTNDQF